MNEQLKVGVIGGLGLMASPMARHWNPKGPVQALRIHDRKTSSERHEKCRQAWLEHGATLVSEIEDVVEPEDLDGVFVCCGKNGDDLSVISRLVDCLEKKTRRQFICHMSTVSAGFAEAAFAFCSNRGVDYVNYPLTGGPVGAEKATMLILASGNFSLFERLFPSLKKLGNPKYFGEKVVAATEVKLMGQIMVFNGLIGICSAAALHADCFQNGKIGGPEQSEFFDFLNAGAGGTRQWDVILSSGIRNNTWDAPFLLSYGAIDAIYTAKLCLDRKTSYLTIKPLIDIALAFSFVINNIGAELATHSIVREMISGRAKELDNFILSNSGSPINLQGCLEKCIQSLPESMRKRVALDITEKDFDI
jgi:3-hydroxyisobutyrate dehydrogenase